MTQPFVDYYRAHRISPVAQDISDLERHLRRRSALYHHLGLAPFAVAGRRVLELGPGSGHNAIHTALLRPARYVLVDGNETGLDAAHHLLEQYAPFGARHEFVHSLIDDYESDERFDLVLCEGVVPFQLDPVRFVKNVSRFVRPGGCLVVTCSSGASFLAETCRRLMRDRFIRSDAPLAEQLALLKPVFAAHLATIQGMSRSVNDWILDSIIQPIIGRHFSIPDAVAALDDSFEVYGGSPLVSDWRWYKQLQSGGRCFNQHAIDSYYTQLMNFVDYRVTVAPHDRAMGVQISELCDWIFSNMQRIESQSVAVCWSETCTALERVAALIELTLPGAAGALREFNAFLNANKASPTAHLPMFQGWFGRGQQYLSLLRHG